MSTDKQDRVEEFLRKSLLGEKIVDTQYHLFSTRSRSSDKVTDTRVLCANNVLLTKSSKYFSDLLNPTSLSDSSLVEITGDDQQTPGEIGIDDYGYGSDSDLEDGVPLKRTQMGRFRTSLVRGNAESELDDDESSEEGHYSAASDTYILDPEEERNLDKVRPNYRGVTVQRSKNDVVLMDQTVVCPQFLNTRRILVRDTAFRIWYALLYYLYTGKITFLPPKSTRTPSPRPLPSSSKEPKCSAKSMYRLANKVGLEDLRNAALQFLRNNITEQNVLKELTSSLVTRYQPLLEMVLDVLYSHVDSPSIVSGLPGLARRIANNEFHHGADIVIGLHQRLLKKHHPLALQRPPQPAVPATLPDDEDWTGGTRKINRGIKKQK